MHIGKDGKYMPEMMFRYRELIYRPDFSDFDKEDCTEWMPNGTYNYNVSRMIQDLACHEEKAEDGKKYLNKVVKTSVAGERSLKNLDISKSDWKLFRVKLADWQEKYMERLVKEYATALTDETRLASDKFWKLEKRIKKDRQHPGVIMEMRKSDAIWDIMRLIRLKVITYEDLSDFSDELQQEVKRLLGMSW